MATTFNTKLNKAIESAQAKVEKAQEKALDKLLENDKFIEVQRAITAKERELNQLNDTVFQLNSIKPYIAKDGRKFSIKVFPVNVFGLGLGTIIGIISGSRGAFVDEKMMEYSAISGITSLELVEAANALGNPSYYKDGKVNDEIKGDFNKLKEILEGIFVKMELHELKACDITEAKYDLWYALAENRANKQLSEHIELQDLEANAKDFVME